MNRDEYKALWRDLQAVRVRIYNALPDLTPEQRATLATDLEQALARLRGGEERADDLQRQIDNFLTYGQGGASFEESQVLERMYQERAKGYEEAVAIVRAFDASFVGEPRQEHAELLSLLENRPPVDPNA